MVSFSDARKCEPFGSKTKTDTPLHSITGMSHTGGSSLLFLIPIFYETQIQTPVNADICKLRKKLVNQVGVEQYQLYYQFLHDEATKHPNLANLVTLGLATFFLGNDVYEAEDLLLRALKTTPICIPAANENIKITKELLGIDPQASPMESRLHIGNALFTLGMIHQYFNSFVQSWLYYDMAAVILNGADFLHMQSREEQIYGHIAKMPMKNLLRYLEARDVEVESSVVNHRKKLEELVFTYRDDPTHYPKIDTFEFTQIDRMVPNLRYDMALNGAAYSRYLHALYGSRRCESVNFSRDVREKAFDVESQKELENILEDTLDKACFLGIAIKLYSKILSYCEKFELEADLIYYFNLAKVHYYQSFYQSENESQHLSKARELFQKMATNERFSLRAEAYSMLSQCFAREKNLGEYELAVQCAKLVDPSVYITDFYRVHLPSPWPLPTRNYVTRKKTRHTFEKIMLGRPRWCDHCLTFIGKPMGFCCTQCDFLVHTGCVSDVELKHCWSKDKQKIETLAASNAHIHKLALVTLHKPTWCGVCSQFIANPLKNYRCTDCEFVCHKSCFTSSVSGVIIK